MSKKVSGILKFLKFFMILVCSVLAQTQVQLKAQAQARTPPVKPDSQEVQTDVEKAKEIAGTVWPMEEHFFCESPHATNATDPGPAKLFDNLYAIPGQYGSANGVVYVISTTNGLMMIDSGWLKDVEPVLITGMKTLGLDPANVKVVIVTHGHPDHYGGSTYFQEHFGAHVVLSAADWDFMLNPPPVANTTGTTGSPPMPPKRDMVAVEGQPITLGEERVIPVLIPGHTPGALGLIFPVKDQGKSHEVAIFGGTMLGQGAPTPQIQQYLHSVDHFEQWTKKMKVDVELQNHPVMDGFGDKLAAIKEREPGQPNPFIVGRDNYTKFLEVMSECFSAALARRSE